MQIDLNAKQVNLLNDISVYLGAFGRWDSSILFVLIRKGYVSAWEEFSVTAKGEKLLESLDSNGYFCDGCGNMKNPERHICLSCEMEVNCV